VSLKWIKYAHKDFTVSECTRYKGRVAHVLGHRHGVGRIVRVMDGPWEMVRVVSRWRAKRIAEDTLRKLYQDKGKCGVMRRLAGHMVKHRDPRKELNEFDLSWPQEEEGLWFERALKRAKGDEDGRS